MDKIVYFVRHGEAESNAKHFFGGQGDVPLTEKGLQQAKALAPLLQHIPFEKLYCSDLQRARITASLALPTHHRICTQQLREIDTGSLTFRPHGELDEQTNQNCKNSNYLPYGGENREMLDARIADFMRKLEADEAGVIGVVCHAGAIQAASRFVLGKAVQKLPVDNCSVSVFQFESGIWKLLRWNVVAHI